jgi:hypothetical protein
MHLGRRAAGDRQRPAGGPSQESREHLVWAQDGLVALAGGKLTTFRRMAQAALAAARPWLPALPPVHRDILPAHAPVAGVPLRWAAGARWPARPPAARSSPAPPPAGASCATACCTSRCATWTTCCCAAAAWAC